MNIEISPQAQQFIDAQIGQGLYHSPAEVIDALVQEKQHPVSLSDEEIAKKQYEAMVQLREECKALAVNPPINDGLNGSTDHDKILYSDY